MRKLDENFEKFSWISFLGNIALFFGGGEWVFNIGADHLWRPRFFEQTIKKPRFYARKIRKGTVWCFWTFLISNIFIYKRGVHCVLSKILVWQCRKIQRRPFCVCESFCCRYIFMHQRWGYHEFSSKIFCLTLTTPTNFTGWPTGDFAKLLDFIFV